LALPNSCDPEPSHPVVAIVNGAVDCEVCQKSQPDAACLLFDALSKIKKIKKINKELRQLAIPLSLLSQ
jgi:hypothetical protein